MKAIIKSLEVNATQGNILEALEDLDTLLRRLRRFTQDGFEFYLGCPTNQGTSYDLCFDKGRFYIETSGQKLDVSQLRNTEVLIKCIVPQLDEILALIIQQFDDHIKLEKTALRNLEALKMELLDTIS